MKQTFRDFIKKTPFEPIVKLVYKYLYWEIISLKMAPGTKINMAKLAEELDVNRSTVRDAILMLVESNLVNSLPNQGYSVSYLNVKEMNDMYYARKCIESGAVRILCEIITRPQIAKFKELLEQMEITTANEDHMQFSALDCEFHKLIVEYCCNNFLIKFYQEIADIVKRYISYTSYTTIFSDSTDNMTCSQLPLLIRQHAMIVNSLELGLPDNAVTVLENHFNDAVRLQLHPDYHIK